MAFEMKNMSGSLFRNDKEGKSENFPDYGGECLIDGTSYYMSAWLKEGKKGKFFSFSFKPKSETGKAAVKEAKAAVDDFVDDDIPPF